jgi:hypothetical protein
MKKLVIFIFSIFLMVNPAQATMISVFDITGASYVQSNDSLQSYGLVFGGSEAPIAAMYPGNINDVTAFRNFPLLTNVLQRTLTYTDADRTGETGIAQAIQMYEHNRLYGRILLYGYNDFGGGNSWLISPIPDLSGFIINGLYADNFTTLDGSTVNYNIRILADVSPAPVPEPSTFILLAIGVTGIGFLRRRGMNKKGLSLS